MKNLLVYVNPQKGFDNEYKRLVQIQIDNSLSLGWKSKDILLATNFDYEYRGVKSFIVDDDYYCPFRPLSTKTITAANLADNGMLEDDQIYWVHDFDAYQLNKFDESDIELGKAELGLTTYGWSPKWCLGSFFFKTSSKDILKLIEKTIYEIHNEDERALVYLTRNNIDNINDRIKKLNITYQIGMRKVEENYKRADKPIKVVHFHPYKRGSHVLGSFMYGKNKLGFPLMTKNLIKLFNRYAIV
jgi:hypothetical protein